MSAPEPFDRLHGRDPQTLTESTRRPTLFYFHDPKLNLCQLINPTISNICKQEAPSVQYVGIETEDHKDLTYEFSVTRAPSFVLYHQGDEVRRYTQIDYDDHFSDEFENFLVGDFLFNSSAFHVVNENNFFSSLREWYQLNLVAFMMPGDPINWQLEPILKTMAEQNKNYLRLHLLNADTDESLLTHYKIQNLPSLILLDETDVVKKWHPASNPDQIRSDCVEVLEEKKS